MDSFFAFPIKKSGKGYQIGQLLSSDNCCPILYQVRCLNNDSEWKLIASLLFIYSSKNLGSFKII